MSAAAEEAPVASAAAAGAGKRTPLLALDTAEAYPVPMASVTSGDYVTPP